jgi:hypothetical protein
MSSHPIDRRHIRPVARPPIARRALTIGVLLVATFAIAFFVGHTRSGGATAERLPPSLPKVPTPVSSALSPAPAIEVGVLSPPPAPPPPATHRAEPEPATTTPSVETPTTSTQAVEPAPVQTTPVAPVQQEPVHVQPAPHPSGGSSKSGSHSGSGSGTSFESSG